MRILFILFFVLKNMIGFSQTSCSMFFLGEYEYKDSVAIDTTLHWYLSNVKEDSLQNIERQFVPIDLQKDIVYRADTDRYHISLDTSLHLNGWLLIGTSGKLSTAPYKEYDNDYSLAMGESIEIYKQYFRDCSPYVNLLVSGEVKQNGWYTTIKKYQLTAGCYFTVYAYHKRYTEENYKSFTQDINKLILPELKHKKISHSYLFLKEYIDNDEYYDMVLYVNGTFILLLSENYDFKNKKLYHIGKALEDKRIKEF